MATSETPSIGNEFAAKDWLTDCLHEHVYIAGPMFGQPGHGLSVFHRAEETLWRWGAIPLSPARGAPPALLVVEVTKACDGEFRDSWLYAAMMRRCMALVNLSRAMFLLPGWEESRGASAEVSAGQIAGVRLFDGSWLLG